MAISEKKLKRFGSDCKGTVSVDMTCYRFILLSVKIYLVVDIRFKLYFLIINCQTASQKILFNVVFVNLIFNV
jgi:hypothetical protein